MCIGLIIALNNDFINFHKLRFLHVTAGVSNSLSYKFKTFNNIIMNFDILNIFIGLGPFQNDLWNITLIDFDIGYLIAFYGLIGFLFYLLMIYDFRKYGKNKHSNYFMLNKLLILIFILFGFTGGVFLNLRIFTVYIILIYSNIIYDSGGEI